MRIPVYGGHGESLNIELERDFDIDEVRELLRTSPGIILQDDPSARLYPMPLTSYERDEVFVGRIRRDYWHPQTLNMWIVADNLRKGAATNAVQIAEVIVNQKRSVNFFCSPRAISAVLMAFTAAAEERGSFSGLLKAIDGGMLSGFSVIDVSLWISVVIVLSAIEPVTCTSVSRQTGFSTSALMVKYSVSSRFFTSRHEQFFHPSIF